jgi:hypothetical protein
MGGLQSSRRRRRCSLEWLPRSPSPPPHPLLRLLRAVVWTGDGTPRQLGLKARGGAVAAYL